MGRADTGMPEQWYDRNCVVQGKWDQSAHILLTPECGEKRTAETSWIAFAADRTLSVSQSVTCTTAAVQTQCVADSAEPGKPEPAVPQKVIVRKDGIEVEMPPDISERLLLTLLRGLQQC